MGKISVITVVLNGELSTSDLDTMAERIRKAIRGEAVPHSTDTSEFKRCDGINIFDMICIGTSKG